MSAYLENMNISRGHALASTALILSVLAILFAVSMRATPCASAASGSCSVGETETFAGDLGLGKDADIEYKISTFNLDKLNNGFFPSVLLQLFDLYCICYSSIFVIDIDSLAIHL